VRCVPIANFDSLCPQHIGQVVFLSPAASLYFSTKSIVLIFCSMLLASLKLAVAKPAKDQKF